MTEGHVDRIRIGIVGSFLLAAAVIYVLMPIIATRWAQIPFAGFVLDPHLVVNDTAVSGWPGKALAEPVAYPERVTAVDGQPVSTAADFYDLLATYQVGDEVTYTLVQPEPGLSVAPGNPERPVRTVTLPLIEFGGRSMWNLFWLVYFVGLIILGIGVWTFVARPREEAAQIFAIFTLFAALTAALLLDQSTTHRFIRVWILVLPLAGSWAALLAFIFPHPSRLLLQRPWLKWMVLVPGTAVALWGQIWLHHGPDPWAYAIPWRWGYVLNALSLFMALVYTFYRSRVSPSALVRQQCRIVLTGAILAFVPLILVFIKFALIIDWPWLTQAIYVPPVVLYPIAIGYTILRYRLLDVDGVLRKGLPYVILIGVLVGALLLILSGLSTALGPDAAMTNPIFVAIFVLTLVLAASPLRDWLQQGLDQVVFSAPVAFDELLRSFNRELTTAVHVEQIADTMLDYTRRAIPDTNVYLYLYDDQQTHFTCYNQEDLPPVSVDSPLVDYMRREPAAIDLAEERAWPAELMAHRDEIAALHVDVLSPINNGRHLFGWLGLFHQHEDRTYSTRELNFLGALADQSLIGLERANVVHRLEVRIADLDVLSRFSQALNFTIVFDDLLELIYTNYHRAFGVEDFFIVFLDLATGDLYPVFYLEDGERYNEREGRQYQIQDERMRKVVQTGQMIVVPDSAGTWVGAPLNAGADTLGAIYTTYPGPILPERQHQLFSVFADRTAVALDRMRSNRQLQIRAQQLEIINQITLTLASTPNLDTLLNLILDKAIELLDTEAGTFMLSHEDTGELEFRVVRGPASEELLGKRLPIGTGLSGRVAQSGRPEIVNRVQEDARWFSDVDDSTEFQTRSILTVPLLRRNVVAGVLQVINKRDGALFDEEDQQLLMAFAGQAVVAMENARLLVQTDQALQDRVNELFLLQQLDRDLNTTLELDRILNLTLDWALRICGGNAGVIVLVDDEGNLVMQVTRGYDIDFDEKQLGGVKLKRGLIAQVLETGRPHVSGNVHTEPNYVAGSASTHSQLTLPILHQERLIGVMGIESDQFDGFTPQMMETAVRVTTHAAVAITNAILYQQVIDANQAKSEFVSMVSHELKTPMTSVRGYTDLMLSGLTGELSEQQRGFLEKIIHNMDRMQRQIRDLTDISRIETGRLQINPNPLDFTSVMSETLPTIQALADEKAIRLHLDLPPDLPRVFGDRERLIQVMTNLLSNACKYSPAETDVSVVLTAGLFAVDGSEPQPMVRCSVRDQGYGISEADQDRLFTKFFRADDPNIRQAPGTGLGLSITRGIIELHGGEIWVDSKLGQGTTFHFTLPQAPPA